MLHYNPQHVSNKNMPIFRRTNIITVSGIVTLCKRLYSMSDESRLSLPNGIPNRDLKHLPQRAVSFLVQIFNAILLTHRFPTVWKHVRVISILKRGRTQRCPHPIGPLFCWTRLVKYLKRSY